MIGQAMPGTQRAPQPWEEQALCREVDSELFFPEQAGWQGAQQAETAKAICGVCPVAAECLAFALADPTLYGIWGGTTRQERKDLRRRWRAAERAARRAARGQAASSEPARSEGGR